MGVVTRGGKPRALSISSHNAPAFDGRSRGSTASARRKTASSASGTAIPSLRGVGLRFSSSTVPMIATASPSMTARPGDRLEERDRETPHVGPRARRAEALRRPLLRRAVTRRERERGRCGLDGYLSDHDRGRVARAGDAEVEDLDDLGAVHLGEKDVGRLDVAVGDAHGAGGAGEVVGDLERARDGREQASGFEVAEGPDPVSGALLDELPERSSLEPLERDERHDEAAVERDDVVVQRPHDLGDGGREAEEHLGFLAEPLEEPGAVLLRDRGNLQALERHGGPKRAVERLVDDAESPFGHRLFDGERSLRRAGDAEDVLGHRAQHTTSRSRGEGEGERGLPSGNLRP